MARASARRAPAAATRIDRSPTVTKLAQLIESDGIVRLYVEEMIEQALDLTPITGKPDAVRDVRGLLDALNYIVTLAPPYAVGGSATRAGSVPNPQIGEMD